jgi:hypothetical protein
METMLDNLVKALVKQTKCVSLRRHLRNIQTDPEYRQLFYNRMLRILDGSKFIKHSKRVPVDYDSYHYQAVDFNHSCDTSVTELIRELIPMWDMLMYTGTSAASTKCSMYAELIYKHVIDEKKSRDPDLVIVSEEEEEDKEDDEDDEKDNENNE